MTLSYNPKSPAWYSGGLDNGALGIGANRGNVYYVNGTSWGDGADTNTGLTPDQPFMTLTHAIAQCTNERFDTIIVVDIWQPTGETWPIVVEKALVSIIGAQGGSYNPWPCIRMTQDTAVFEVQATGVRIMNFHLEAGVSHACIEFSAEPQRVGIYGNYFNAGTYGVDIGVNECGMALQVDGNYFATYLTAGGIRLGNNNHARIANNVFGRVGGVAIEVASDGNEGQILNNVIAMPSDTQGIGITLGASADAWVVDGNSAFWGETVNNNPYLDSAAANANSWGMNHHGNTHVLPV